MPEPIQISGKNLGELNHVAYCPRCVWLKLRLRYNLPYQIFPGIFSSIDAYTKRVVRHCFRTGGLPEWLPGLGEIVEYHTPPGYQSFSVVDRRTGIRLTGAADAFLERSDGSYVIVDYKTSRHTRGQDALRPTYEAQLNAYAWIAERTGWGPVGALALVYMHPLTEKAWAERKENHRNYGFALGFRPHVEIVGLKPDLVPALLARARALYDEPSPPRSRNGCRDCAQTDHIATLIGRT